MAPAPYRPTTTDIFSPLEALFGPLTGNRVGDVLRAPSADVIERENEIEVDIEIPGLNPEDIHIDLENNLLTVSGEKREQRTEGDDGESGTYHLCERRYGRFTRSFVLPRDVEPEQIRAHCEDGLLRITVPKSERARRRRIEVQRGNGGRRQIEAKGTETKSERQ